MPLLGGATWKPRVFAQEGAIGNPGRFSPGSLISRQAWPSGRLAPTSDPIARRAVARTSFA